MPLRVLVSSLELLRTSQAILLNLWDWHSVDTQLHRVLKIRSQALFNLKKAWQMSTQLSVLAKMNLPVISRDYWTLRLSWAQQTKNLLMVCIRLFLPVWKPVTRFNSLKHPLRLRVLVFPIPQPVLMFIQHCLMHTIKKHLKRQVFPICFLQQSGLVKQISIRSVLLLQTWLHLPPIPVLKWIRCLRLLLP